MLRRGEGDVRRLPRELLAERDGLLEPPAQHRGPGQQVVLHHDLRVARAAVVPLHCDLRGALPFWAVERAKPGDLEGVGAPPPVALARPLAHESDTRTWGDNSHSAKGPGGDISSQGGSWESFQCVSASLDRVPGVRKGFPRGPVGPLGPT
jgi:hypothetical protein